MPKPLLNFEQVRSQLKQRFPMLMIDSVLAIEPEKRIQASKNVTGNELPFLGHFPDKAVMPGTLIVEAIGQAASILFSSTARAGLKPGEFLVLSAINNMRFLVRLFQATAWKLTSKSTKSCRTLRSLKAS